MVCRLIRDRFGVTGSVIISNRSAAAVQLQASEAIAYGERHPHRFSYT
jgi:hypothetical protein